MFDNLLTKVKGKISAALLYKVADMVSEGREDRLKLIFDLISKLSPAAYQRKVFKELSDMVESEHPLILVFKRVFKELNPLCRQKLIMNLVVNFMVVSRAIREQKEKELGVSIPNFIVISPTMKCNLRCKGCYAAMYDTSSDLTTDELDRIISEAKDLGIFFFTISGGEPFTRKDLLDIAKKHSDCYFQVYTNGTLLDEQLVKKLAELGNIAPMISVEGTQAETDYRRGEGTYEKIMQAMKLLREHGVLFGFSATCTRRSAELISSDEFIDKMIECGCKVGWFFQYIPTGCDPDLSYMATPKQRAHLHEKVEEWRQTKPIFLGDFWNDGPYVDGCMAGGRRYLHIISNGDVEPCVFAHFAVDNIRQKSLVEVLKSPFFSAIRDAQPYEDDNLLRPCMIIDHPDVLKELVEKYNAHPTHEGAEKIITEFYPYLKEYAEELRKIYDPVWEEYWRDKYIESLKKEENLDIWQRMEKKAPGKYLMHLKTKKL